MANKLKYDLDENMEYLSSLFLNAADFTPVNLCVDGVECVFLSLEGQIDRQYLSISVMQPFIGAKLAEVERKKSINYLATQVIRVIDQEILYSFDDVITKLMLGFGVILVDGCDSALSFGGQGYKVRSVENPADENMLRGSKEGFIEALQINMSLLRRKMRNTDLKFERMTVGKKSFTPIIVSYIEGRVSPEILQRLKLEIKEIDLETVMASGYLTAYLNKGKIFGTVGVTERPDTACAKMEEGRIIILVDGSPGVLIVPYIFTENFQSMDDYDTKPFYSSYIRYIKYLCFFISAFLPAIYVGLIAGRPELLPDEILVKIAIAESKTPFNVFWEIILANFLYEIMREAGIRAPKVFSHSVSIVGALVVGDMAVSAGLMGSPSLIIIALAAISGYAIPKLFEQLALIRLFMIIISGLFGVWGFVCGFMFFLINICSQNAFGIPVTAPLSPFSLKFMRDILERAPWMILNKNRNKIQELPGVQK